jgi:hypothetical protein
MGRRRVQLAMERNLTKIAGGTGETSLFVGCNLLHLQHRHQSREMVDARMLQLLI